MNSQDMINGFYTQAVAGLNEDILRDGNVWYSYIEKLPSGPRFVYCVVIFNQQVLNGGFHQYFFNSYGQFAYITVNMLVTIGAVRSANILSRALKRVNENELAVDNFNSLIFNRQLTSISEFDIELGDFLDKLDDEYYSSGEDVIQLLANYLKSLP